MKKEEIDKQDFQELIEKYLDGHTTLEELKLLVNYYESYQHEHVWVEELGSEDVIRNRVLINILEELQNNDEMNSKVVPFYQKTIVKYGVAASIILFIGLTFFLNNNTDNVPEIKVVDTKESTVKIGTDKAILILNDGGEVALEKGETYQNDNIKSDGEEIVYKTGVPKTVAVEYNCLVVPRGGQFSIKLSDGTQVWLNSESKIKYPVKFIEGEPRKVELVYGEAYFDVSPSSEHNGDKFLVFNDSQEVEVVGTEFNVKAYKDETNIYTTLVEGKVAISIDDKKRNLVPGQQLYLDKTNSTLLIKSVDVYNETAWKDGVFSFENKTLKEMMVVLSRWYDVEVIIENKSIENQEFVGILRKNQKIEEILANIKNFGIIKNYKIYDKKVTLE